MPDPTNSRAWQIPALIRAASVATPLQSELGQSFISIPLQTEAHQVVPLRSAAFQNWLLDRFYSEHHIVPRASAVQDVIQLLEAKTQFGGTARVPVARRIAAAPGKVILDLYNDQGEVVEISAKGWRITQNLGAHFRSTRSARPLPRPENAATLAEFRVLLQVTTEHCNTCMSWLESAMLPAGPYPILVVQGPGQSSVAKLLRALVDPGPAAFCPAPLSVRDLQSLASHNWILAFDKIERLPSGMLRQLIGLSSGATFAARDRASDPEPFHVFLQRPILVTTAAALSPELAASAVTVNAPVEIIDDANLRPRILGALCNAISQALANGHPRFRVSTAPTVPDNNIATALAAFMQDRSEWTGTATGLLADLRRAHPSVEWPATAKGLSQLLHKTALSPVSFESIRHPAGHRSIRLTTKSPVLVNDAPIRREAAAAAPTYKHPVSNHPASPTAAPASHRSSQRTD